MLFTFTSIINSWGARGARTFVRRVAVPISCFSVEKWITIYSTDYELPKQVRFLTKLK